MQTLIERPPNKPSKDHASVAVFPPLPFALAVVAGVLVRRYSSSMMATFHGSYKEESTLRNQSRCGFIKDIAHDHGEGLGLPPLIARHGRGCHQP